MAERADMAGFALNTHGGDDPWGGMDDLDTHHAARPAPAAHAKIAPAAQLGLGVARSTEKVVGTVAQFKCEYCRGSGRFVRGFINPRDYGPCNKCKGTGKLKTSPEARTARKQVVAQRKRDARTDYQALHVPEFEWVRTQAPRFGFAAEMLQAVNLHGSWTDGQLAAIRKCQTRDLERATQKAARTGDVDLAGAGFTRMLDAFAHAKGAGLIRCKFRVAQLTFSPAKPDSANAGFIYVKSSDTYVGKISATGQFFGGRDCSPVILAEITRIGRDPLAAAVMHGRETGHCSCCGRLLENEESVALGIGPVCREKWGL